MDPKFLEELINEVKTRDGGIILSLKDKPEAVIMSVEKYNEMVLGAPTGGLSRTGDKPAGLVTGGAGYIGAHVVRALVKEGYKAVVLDNLSTGRRENVHQLAAFYEGDAGDFNLLKDIFEKEKIFAVIHMAASLEVGESVLKPVEYFQNNVVTTTSLLKAMSESGVKNFVFSSTAAVYGQQEKMPISETAQTKPNNPYGASKLMCEKACEYFCEYAGFSAVIFRYFNACGCDFDGSIASVHESHLIPNVLRVAAGKLPHITVYGNDYDTFDGTGVRDYVHVLDIAEAHVRALENFIPGQSQLYNLGTGRGFSVEQLVSAASEILNRIIPMEIGPRRPGDCPITVADVTKAYEGLGFSAKHSDLDTIIRTTWKQMTGK